MTTKSPESRVQWPTNRDNIHLKASLQPIIMVLHRRCLVSRLMWAVNIYLSVALSEVQLVRYVVFSSVEYDVNTQIIM